MTYTVKKLCNEVLPIIKRISERRENINNKPIIINLQVIIPEYVSSFQPDNFGQHLESDTRRDYYLDNHLRFIFYRIYDQWYIYKIQPPKIFEGSGDRLYISKGFYVEELLFRGEINSNEEAKKIFMDCEEKIKNESKW